MPNAKWDDTRSVNPSFVRVCIHSYINCTVADYHCNIVPTTSDLNAERVNKYSTFSNMQKITSKTSHLFNIPSAHT
jgi:hypothetical protein